MFVYKQGVIHKGCRQSRGVHSNADNCGWGWVKGPAGVRNLVFLVSLFRYVLLTFLMGDAQSRNYLLF